MPIENLYEFPDLFEVDFRPGAHKSGLKSLVDFKENQVMARLIGMSRVPIKTWSSVQYGPGENDHIEFNSVLLYANHSCLPNSIIDETISPGSILQQSGNRQRHLTAGAKKRIA
ncbi:hypothetical protein OPQ81_000255 [Rhizoctonia solani]|nr:hypothetical protein OPQ81_000255 [Rhizoctonia solani]